MFKSLNDVYGGRAIIDGMMLEEWWERVAVVTRAKARITVEKKKL